MMTSFQIFAPASIGNVASGFDVLGLAVDDLGDYFHFTAADRYSITVEGRDAALVPLEPERNAVSIAAEHFYAAIGCASQAFHVHSQRHLPLAGGLGSSAAASVAGAMAAAKFCRALDRRELILQAALAAETAVAGPHLDNIAPCLLGGLTLIQDLKTLRIYQIAIAAKFWITLLSPQLQMETKAARKILPKQLDTAQWTQQMAHCTSLALAMAQGDLSQLSFGLEDPFAEVYRSPLIPGFLPAKREALRLGAYGFSISGSGPSCFALSPDEATAQRIGELGRTYLGPHTLVHVAQPRSTGASIL